MEDTSKFRGVVKGMREDYDDKSKVCVDVELPEKKTTGTKTGGGKGSAPVAFKPTRSVTVSQEMAASLSVGDGVEVATTVRPFGPKSGGAAAREEAKESS